MVRHTPDNALPCPPEIVSAIETLRPLVSYSTTNTPHPHNVCGDATHRPTAGALSIEAHTASLSATAVRPRTAAVLMNYANGELN